MVIKVPRIRGGDNSAAYKKKERQRHTKRKTGERERERERERTISQARGTHNIYIYIYISTPLKRNSVQIKSIRKKGGEQKTATTTK